jgi:hypothetical protein
VESAWGSGRYYPRTKCRHTAFVEYMLALDPRRNQIATAPLSLSLAGFFRTTSCKVLRVRGGDSTARWERLYAGT